VTSIRTIKYHIDHQPLYSKAARKLTNKKRLNETANDEWNQSYSSRVKYYIRKERLEEPSYKVLHDYLRSPSPAKYIEAMKKKEDVENAKSRIKELLTYRVSSSRYNHKLEKEAMVLSKYNVLDVSEQAKQLGNLLSSTPRINFIDDLLYGKMSDREKADINSNNNYFSKLLRGTKNGHAAINQIKSSECKRYAILNGSLLAFYKKRKLVEIPSKSATTGSPTFRKNRYVNNNEK